MFPDMFGSYLQSPIPKRAADRGIADIHIIDIKQYAGGSFRHIDDDTYGGGAGAVLRAKPVLAALQAALAEEEKCPDIPARENPNSGSSFLTNSSEFTPAIRNTESSSQSGTDISRRQSPDNNSQKRTIAALTPVGRLYDQQTAERYSHLDHLILICGHYEGMDERIYHHVDERISIGDYILSGGELASQVVTDSILRLLPGVLRAASTADESFTSTARKSAAPSSREGSGFLSCSSDKGLLEYPQYTRPADLEGDQVPSVLLSGDHESIRRWRLKESLRATLQWRPDLLAAHHLTAEEEQLLADIRQER